jgi:WD40 repeat protein
MRALAVHPGGQQVVTAGNGLALEVWNPRDGMLLHREKPCDVGIQAAAYRPDGAHFATAGSDATVRIWSSTDFKPLRRLKGHGQGFGIAYGSEGKYLALRDTQGVKVWEAATGRLAAELLDPATIGGPVAFSPDGQHLAGGHLSGMVTIWDLKTARPLRRLTGHTGGISGLAYSPDGKRLVSCSHDRSVKVWDPVAGEELLTLQGTAGLFHCVAFSPCGKYLITGADGGIRIWEGLR